MDLQNFQRLYPSSGVQSPGRALLRACLLSQHDSMHVQTPPHLVRLSHLGGSGGLQSFRIVVLHRDSLLQILKIRSPASFHHEEL